MNLNKRLLLLLVILVGLAGFFSGSQGNPLSAGALAPPHLVILGDPHLPGKFLGEKEKVLGTINSWSDVTLVVAVGDICEDLGTEKEYAAAKLVFSRLTKPYVPVPGNHDFIYDDIKRPNGKRMKGTAAEKQKKLARFQQTFALPALYHSKPVGNYQLIFLATDEVQSDQLTRLSPKQLDWLRAELKRHLKNPTVIFFHAPLSGTLSNYNKYANSTDFVAQPEDDIRALLRENPQVFLWVCGHMHVPATNKDFRADINFFENRVYTLHNSDMNRETIWTNSVFLLPDKVVIKTYNHRLGAWLPELEKTLVPPRL